MGVAGQLLDHLHFLPRRLLRLTVCVNLHHIQAVGFLIINLLKLARSADKVPSPSLVLLPISIPRPLPTFQPFHCHRLHLRTLATRYGNGTMKSHNDGRQSRKASQGNAAVVLPAVFSLLGVSMVAGTSSGRAPAVLPLLRVCGGSGSSGAAALSKWEN